MSKSIIWLKRVSLCYLILLLLLVLLADRLPLRDPLAIDMMHSLQPPSVNFLAGTDLLGRDLLSRLIFAGKSTLMITVFATILSIAIGIVMGIGAGFMGGLWRVLVDFCIDLFWSLPFVVFVILIVAILGTSPLVLILSIGGINWVTSARILRDETATLKKQGFIQTMRAFGFKDSTIAFVHLLTNLKPTILSLLAYAAVEVLVLETGLAFLGLSKPPPQPTWGGLLADGLSYFSSAWWMPIAPTIAIIITIGSFHVLAKYHEKTAINLGR
jgi:peptide/nickel transport system permease protein